MDIEYEATYKNINKDEVRERLRNVGAQFVQPEYLQKSLIFNMPKGHEVFGGWVRVRDEGDRITMSFKVVSGDKLHDQKEKNLKMKLKWFRKGLVLIIARQPSVLRICGTVKNTI